MMFQVTMHTLSKDNKLNEEYQSYMQVLIIAISIRFQVSDEYLTQHDPNRFRTLLQILRMKRN